MSDRPITDRADLAGFIAASGGGPHYVYLLRMPDGEPKFGGLGTPFYVGIGQGRGSSPTKKRPAARHAPVPRSRADRSGLRATR